MASKKKCIILQCNSHNLKLGSRSFHSFPANMETNLKWREAIQDYANIENLNDYSVICNRHFEERCFYFTQHKRLLNPGTIPTIFQPTNIPVINERGTQFIDNGTQTEMGYLTNSSTQTVSKSSVECLQYKLKVLSLKLKRLGIRFNRTKQELQIEKEKQNNGRNYASIQKIMQDADRVNSKAIFIMDQIHNYKKMKPQWSEITIRECINWRLRFPKGYEYPRNSFLKLPGKTTLKKYLATENKNLHDNLLLPKRETLNSIEEIVLINCDETC